MNILAKAGESDGILLSKCQSIYILVKWVVVLEIEGRLSQLYKMFRIVLRLLRVILSKLAKNYMRSQRERGGVLFFFINN